MPWYRLIIRPRLVGELVNVNEEIASKHSDYNRLVGEFERAA
ncbi:hypothetical protein ACFLWY_04200 [Chloroflexota bacterium]